MKTRRGFSLTELAVVLGIIVLASATVFAAIGPLLRRSQLQAGGAMITRWLDGSRTQAVFLSVQVTVDFPSRSEMRITIPPNRQGDKPEVRIVTLPKGISLESALPPSIICSPDGSTSGITVTIHDDRDIKAKRVIRMNEARGKLTVGSK